MDTSTYLKRQGWRGDGHSLHPTGRGIKKPLLVSQKANLLGVGKKKHDAHADQWWARAFDSTLKGLAITKSEKTGVLESVTATWSELDLMKAGGSKWTGSGGLYAGFVRGEGLVGTVTVEGAHSAAAKDIDVESGEKEKVKDQQPCEDVTESTSNAIQKEKRREKKQKAKKRKSESESCRPRKACSRKESDVAKKEGKTEENGGEELTRKQPTSSPMNGGGSTNDSHQREALPEKKRKKHQKRAQPESNT